MTDADKTRARGRSRSTEISVKTPVKAPVETPVSSAKRMRRDQRERAILQEAVRFFAEVGFEGQVHELARRLGVTKALIFKYYPTKEDLIERVYQEVYMRRWNPLWEDLLTDRSRPLADRLVAFYTDYCQLLNEYEWIRIFVYSGLRGVDITRRYIGHLRDRVILRICGEIRAEFGLPDSATVPVSAVEMELVWGLHSVFVYQSTRRWVYGTDVPADLRPVIAATIASFLHGVPAVFKNRICGPA